MRLKSHHRTFHFVYLTVCIRSHCLYGIFDNNLSLKGLIINVFSTVFCTNSFHQSVDFPVLLSVALVYLIELIGMMILWAIC